MLQSCVLGKLRSLRMLLRGRLLLEGVGWFVLGIIALILVTLAFDYTLHLNREQRIMITALCCVGILVIVWKTLLAPQTVAMKNSDLALLVERHYGQLDDRLISTLELTDREMIIACGASEEMVAQMSREANDIASQLKFSKIVEMRRMGKVWILTGIALLMMGSFTVLKSDVMSLWFQRNVLMSNIDWPQDTYLCVYYVNYDGQLAPLMEVAPDGTITNTVDKFDVLRGEDMKIVTITTDGSETPDQVKLHAWYPSVGDTEGLAGKLSGQQATKYLAKLPGQSSRGVYVQKISGVSEEFRFYVTGGDDKRDKRNPHNVCLVDPPAVKQILFPVEFPAYMRKTQSEPVDGSRGVLSIPLGSTVYIQAMVNKDLMSGELIVNEKSASKLEILNDSKNRPRELRGSFTVDGKNVPRSDTLRFTLKDTSGYSNRRGEQIILQVIPDAAPSIKLQFRGVRNVICPTAMIPLIVSGKDDNGIERIDVSYICTPPEKESADAPASPTRRALEPILSGPEIKKQLVANRTLDIQPLKLIPGSKVRVKARGLDLLPKNLQGPNAADSNELTFSVITTEELLAQLVGKQKEVQLEFFMAMGQQALSQGRCDAVSKQLASGKIGPTVPQRLTDAIGRQLAVTNESIKAADTLHAVADEMEFNRIGKPQDHQAIRTNIVLPLRHLVTQMREVLQQLQAASKINDPAQLREKLEKIVAEQTVIYEEMEKILKHMRKLENRLEIARRLEQILIMSRELEEILRQRADESTSETFED